MRLDEIEEETASRHCWECVRRRVVCDRALPTCKKCLKVDKQCPGYDEQRPLQWIENGKVTSRRAKKEITPKLLARSNTAGSTPTGHDREIQQLSMSVLTVVDGRLGHQHQPASTATGAPTGSYRPNSATPPTYHPQYSSTQAGMVPADNMGQSMRHQSTTSYWDPNSTYDNRQFGNETTAARVRSTTTYPQMSYSNSNGYNGYGQTQQQFQPASQTWAPEDDPSEVHAQFLFL